MVDDHIENLVALEAALSDLDVNFIKAQSGQEALKHLLDKDFAVILLDVQMPGMDRLELANMIRGRERSYNTPIIFITAIGKSEEHVFKGYAVGAVDYIFKPFLPEILKAKVSVFIELFRVKQQLIFLADHDVLTGLPNRRSLEESIKRFIARAKRGNKSALLFIDLDNFKTVNDSLGHHAGDTVLVEITRLLLNELRTEDILFRWGGDEFAVVLDGINTDGAKVVAERMMVTVDNNRFVLNNKQFHLSLSVGLVRIDGEMDTLTLLSKADGAMYRAKEQGKNRIVLHGDYGKAG